jgi:hypothetical protein
MLNQRGQGDGTHLGRLVDDDEPIRSAIRWRQLSGLPGEQADEILGCKG